VSCSEIPNVYSSNNSPNKEGLTKEGLTREGRETERIAFNDIKVEGLEVERLIRAELEKEENISEIKSLTIRVAKSDNGYYDKNDFYGYEYVDTGAIMKKLAIGAGVLVVRAV
jgi:type II restriction/modification system DNA methylase subunit YeeA